MNTHSIFSAAGAEVDAAVIAPLPQSRKIYQQGSRPDIRVPFREVSQDDTPTMFGGEKNPPLTIYDTVSVRRVVIATQPIDQSGPRLIPLTIKSSIAQRF